MKKVLILLSAICLSTGNYSNLQAQARVKDQTNIKFDKLSHDFGKVKEGTSVTCEFNFTNVSDRVILIEPKPFESRFENRKNMWAFPTCGCTTTKIEGFIYVFKDIFKENSDKNKGFEPSGKGKLLVTYDTQGRVGVFKKYISIYLYTKLQCVLEVKIEILPDE